MNYTVSVAILEDLNAYWTDPHLNLNWNPVFITPDWLQAWWHVFGEVREPFIRIIRDGNSIIGIAPLMREGNTAAIIGDTDVCDYLDFIVAPGRENEFFKYLLDDLRDSSIENLDLKHVRPDSTVATPLAGIARSLNMEVVATREDVSVEMELPPTWEEYLGGLASKQRHEVRRKLRRLAEAGEINYRFIDDISSTPGFMDRFFKMFTESRQDKAAFLTEQREVFFRLLVEKTTATGLLKLGMLELDGRVMAAVICFDYDDGIYLYNSGYDPEFNYLSVGWLSKVLCIKESIESGKKIFDFLKGDEPYKYHLGGKGVPLYRYQISLV